MFDATGKYTPPDVPTRHVVVVHTAYTGRLRNGMPVPVAAGLVTWEGMRGQTQVAAMGPPMHPNMAMVEHATAKAGDILPMDEVTPAVATATTKQNAVRTYQDAMRKEHPLVAPALAAMAKVPS